MTTLLLDRDGTVIKDKHYLANPAGVELLPGVGETLGLLAQQGLRFFLVSNQSGVGRGYFSREAVLACNARLEELLSWYGVRLAGSVFCPHAPEDRCLCRKPASGMWEALRDAYQLNPGACLMVGDKPEDMLFAHNAGLAESILVLTGKGEESAKALGLDWSSLCGEGVDCMVQEQALPGCPSLVIRDFFTLPRALSLMEQRSARRAPDAAVELA